MNARRVAAILAFAAAIALGAHIDVPMHPVPMSLQSLAIVLAGAMLGPAYGALAVALYLAAGAIGLPVFAGGASGAAHLVGPTAGYLWGFLIAVFVVGAMVARGCGENFAKAFAAMALGHTILLGLGAARLALLMPPADAIAGGLTPFLLGALVKSALAAALVRLWRATQNGRAPSA